MPQYSLKPGQEAQILATIEKLEAEAGQLDAKLSKLFHDEVAGGAGEPAEIVSIEAWREASTLHFNAANCRGDIAVLRRCLAGEVPIAPDEALIREGLALQDEERALQTKRADHRRRSDDALRAGAALARLAARG